ncbi:hypothetical protein PINS_up014555 [Pythium insidiosum]|nr:hypothetical protein PINS_up014555 [Pythium insidiosum]
MLRKMEAAKATTNQDSDEEEAYSGGEEEGGDDDGDNDTKKMVDYKENKTQKKAAHAEAPSCVEPTRRGRRYARSFRMTA